MEANKKTLFDVFNGSRLLEIPFFQRSYVWGEDEWERLFDDVVNICQNKKEYFMGSLILKQKLTGDGKRKEDIWIVIDGQQRLTTLSILLKVLCLKKDKQEKFDEMFLCKSDSFILQYNEFSDDIEYKDIMDLREEPVTERKPKRKGKKEQEERKGFLGAYNYFKKRLEDKDEDTNTDILEILDFDTICKYLCFVVIELDLEDDEQQIFDTINSLGVRLTTAELLKNYFFDDGDINKYKRNWQSIFEKDGKKDYWNTMVSGSKKTLIDIFFFAYLQIKVGEMKIPRKDFSRLDRLFASYKSFVADYFDGNKKKILSEIKKYSDTFKNVIDPSVLDKELPREPGIKRINAIIFALDTTTIIPYVLYVEHNLKNDEDEKNRIYDYLESFIMRRIVTKMSTKNYSQLFSEQLILSGILTEATLKEYFATQKDKTNCMPDDEKVKKGFYESHLTNNQARVVLYFIESRMRDGNYSTSLHGINGYSLEHMMPKNWNANWPKSDTFSTNERNNILLTLGNLAIVTSSLNESMRDNSWQKKLKGNNKNKGLKCYSKGIETMFGALNKREWNEKNITERAKKLAKKALEIWKN